MKIKANRLAISLFDVGSASSRTVIGASGSPVSSCDFNSGTIDRQHSLSASAWLNPLTSSLPAAASHIVLTALLRRSMKDRQ